MNWMAKRAMVARMARTGVLSRAMVGRRGGVESWEIVVSEETGAMSWKLWSLLGQR